MRRILVATVTVFMVFSMLGMAQATQVKWKGQFDYLFQWADNLNFYDSDEDNQSEDDFGARQRVRLIMNFIASKDLKGQFFIESGETVWGNPAAVGRSSGGALGTDGVSIEVRRAFIDFRIPDTSLKFKVGLQGVGLPHMGLGNPILSGADSDMGAIVASYKFNETFSMVALWGRPFDLNGDIVAHSPANDEMDVFVLSVPMNFEGVKFNPYVMYSRIGEDVVAVAGPRRYSLGAILAPTEPVNAWWAGFSFELSMFEPLWFGLDFAYGSASGNYDFEERSGWTAQAELDYKLDMLTIGLLGWYSTGDDTSLADGSETMPTIDGRFMGSSFGFFGSATTQVADRRLSWSTMGSWGIGLVLKDISFVENLSHVFRVLYMRGTNDGDISPFGWVSFRTPRYGVPLGDEDSAWEVNFDTYYNIYDQLKLIVETGYMSANRDDDTWGGLDDTSDAWKFAIALQYKF